MQPARPIGLDHVNHVSLSVADLERSLHFYVALTGVEPDPAAEQIAGDRFRKANGGESSAMRWATLALHNLEINLVEFAAHERQPPPRRHPGTMHLCFRTGDLDETVARLRSAGVELVADPYTVPAAEGTQGARGMRFAYFDDPDGNHLELIERSG